MIHWLERNGTAVQALTGIVTMLVALGALIGVKVQIDATERIQQAQSARDIYREYLNLSISKPEFATPDLCKIKGTEARGAYENYVQYMLYTSEQILSADDGWEATLVTHLAPHRDLLCSETDWVGDTPEVKGLIERFRKDQCTSFTPTTCGEDSAPTK
jgi:hypothetical protein